MWSVVHFPTAFISTCIPVKSLPSHAGNGSSSCSRSLVGLTETLTPPGTGLAEDLVISGFLSDVREPGTILSA